MEYQTIVRENYGVSKETVYEKCEEFDKIVNNKIQEGWRPQGGVTVSTTKENDFIIALGMVKE